MTTAITITTTWQQTADVFSVCDNRGERATIRLDEQQASPQGRRNQGANELRKNGPCAFFQPLTIPALYYCCILQNTTTKNAYHHSTCESQSSVSEGGAEVTKTNGSPARNGQHELNNTSSTAQQHGTHVKATASHVGDQHTESESPTLHRQGTGVSHDNTESLTVHRQGTA